MAFDFLTDSKNFFFGSTVGEAVAQPPLVGIGSPNLNATGLGGQILSGVPGVPTERANLLFGVLHNKLGLPRLPAGPARRGRRQVAWPSRR